MEFVRSQPSPNEPAQLLPINFDSKTGYPCVPGLQPCPEHVDFSKTSSTLRHLYREWSKGGEPERAACFEPLLDYLLDHFKDIPAHKRHTIKILNPGCGLGRFVFELASLGFEAEGCELSYHMLIGSMHMMNFCDREEQYRIHPFVLNGSNHLSHENRIRHVAVPDIYPRDALEEASKDSEIHGSDRLGISTGDFCVVYKQEPFKDKYDVISTIFFLDTAKNPMSYFETVQNCLKPGGIWMNLGPLKWHFQPYEQQQSDIETISNRKQHSHEEDKDEDHGIANPGSVVLTEQDIFELLKHYGFELLHYKDITTRPTGYVHDHKSMETNMFYPSFWVVRKKSAIKRESDQS